MHRGIAALAGFAVALAGCSEARRVAGAEAVSCGHCHDAAGSLAGTPAGAHAAHVRVLGSLACGQCHPDPRAGSTAHRNGHVDVVFGALATHDGVLSPRLDPGTLRCTAVYCHGSFAGGNAENAPIWTSVGQGAADCGTCHGIPPGATHAAISADPNGCVRCHATTLDADGKILAGGKHLDGRLDSHDDPWMVPTSARFHGPSARQDLSICEVCHGQDLAGGAAGVACAACHGSGGQLTCTSCHRSVPGSDATRSSHLAGAGTPSSDCRTCHDVSQQAEGHFRLPAPGGSFPQTSCLACHDGQGEVLSGRTPPLLVGWSDTVAGDWHGARTGTGYGGTLRAPYARGQDPLPCKACHDQHSSENVFLLASTVNGTAIPVAAIDRAGVGGEVLCAACHEGERHAGCIPCHGADPEPAGNPCFWCHGHEGILQWYPPEACDNCHSISQPPVEHVAPAISGPPAVSGVTATSATVRWSTNEGATSFVEYGVSTAGSVAGNNALVGSHVVTLSGLEPGTSYVWRVRSSDAFRNVAESPLDAFTTPGADEVPRPDVAPVWAATNVPNTTVPARLLWYPVTAPSGTAVEYEVQLASDPGFTFLANADLSRVDDTLATGNSGWIGGTATTDGNGRPAVGFDVMLTNLPQDDCGSTQPNVYYFRVRARDQTGKVSVWSTTGSFTAMAWDRWC